MGWCTRRVPDTHPKPDGFRYGYQFLPTGMKFYPQSMCWRVSICSTRPELDPLPLLSHRNLSATATYEHANSALSSTCLQSIGGSGESEEPGRSSPVAPGPTAPEDSGAGIASPGAALLGIPRPAPRTTRLRDRPPASSHDQGPVLSTSTLTAPSDTPLASCSSRTSAPAKGWHCSHPVLPHRHLLHLRIGDSSNFNADPSGTAIPWGAAIDGGEPEGTMVGSLALVADGTVRGKSGDVTECATGR
jgi:hypothetical protein